MTIQAFEVAIPDATLDDLADRLARTRLAPDRSDRWDAGTSPAYLRSLVAYWRDGYAWREREAAINRFPQFVAAIGAASVHFIHVRGTGDAPLPIVLTHGYPDSFLRFAKLIPLLADPAAHGGDAADAFDVVVPSLPGFGFSAAGTDIFHTGDLWHALMTELGYARYAAHGGDWGSTVTAHLGRSHARSLVGIHLTDVPFWHGFQKPHDASAAEKAYFAELERWQSDHGAYAMIQGTRPGTLADGLTDSPAGLAAWLVDLLRRFSDCDGDLERRFTRDEVLDNIMLYWVTGAIRSAFQPYDTLIHAGAGRWMLEKAKDLLARARVPAGFALFPRETTHPPRSWAERFFHVARWTEMPRGGHFTAFEEPELLAEDLRAFFRPLRRPN